MIRLRPLPWLPLCGLLAVSCVKPEALPPRVPSPAAATVVPAKPTVPTGTVTAISLNTFFSLQQSGGTLIYDVRPGFFYRLGHIPGAVSWPKGKFESGLATHEPELATAAKAKRPIVLYCTDRECPDAGSVGRKLTALGYSVELLEGGFEDWKAADMPVE